MPDTSPNPLHLLPHRDPFRFLTRVTELRAGEFGHAQWDLTGDEDFFRGHFPGDPIVPGVLLTEALAQLSGLVAYSPSDTENSAEGSGGLPLNRVRLAQSNMKFPASAAPPTTIDLFAEFVRSMGPLSLLRARAESRSQVVAEGTITLGDVGGTWGGVEGV